MLNTIENINKKMHVTGSLINLKTIQENFEKINSRDIHSEEERKEIMDFLNTSVFAETLFEYLFDKLWGLPRKNSG